MGFKYLCKPGKRTDFPAIQTMKNKGKVLVAMSGGIDSTVAALLLHEEGYEVVGITMKTWDYATSVGTTGKKETGCCNLDSFNDARQAAVDHGFPHYVIDIRDEFGDFVVQNFVDEYLAGRTPNPCVLCNTHIKWAALLKRADALGCDFIATGHYAQVREEEGRWVLSKAHDLTKDQSYVLWGLPQETLSRTLFPLGGFLKTEVRKMAAERGYVELSQKAESYEICFVPDNDYRGFLKRNVEGLEARVDGGNYVLTDGTVVGKHKGYPFYTIGQRKGLDIALGRPVFVTEIHPETNTVVLGNPEDLKSVDMRVKGMNWMKYPGVTDGMAAITKIRYKDPGTTGFLQADPADPESVLVHFDHAVSGIAPGQSAVFYDGDDVIGGGIIQHL